jgi:diaminohydroxyphosphoribosylaminopyrimidine deaminase/5-amino-6-(5-phosphoribosylamino)uracil reductase
LFVTESSNLSDQHFMQRALQLARAGVGLCSPNPHVGAVVVSRQGQVVGEGTHTYEGRKHAEVIALEAAGENACGSTLYLNLEPCCHVGRTGPCSRAVIAAGVSRVVAAMTDPNPAVAGKGFEQLRDAGIDVVVGVEEAQARKLNDWFARYIRTGLPLVTLKAAMTLDGKIAPPPGESANPSALGSAAVTRGWITSELARAHVHELRHASDAILVGVGTVIADDPLLTDRSGRPRRRRLLRVILDSKLRIPLESRVVKTAADDLIVVCSSAPADKRKSLEARGVKVMHIDADPATGRPCLDQLVSCLGEMQIASLMIEGGALINSAALQAGIVDKVFLYYAPKILGGAGTIPFVSDHGWQGAHVGTTCKPIVVRDLELHRFGEDFAAEGYIRNPYE